MVGARLPLSTESLAFLWIHWAKSLVHPDPAATPEDSHPNILNLIFSFLRPLQCSALPFCLQLERRTFLLRRRRQAIPSKEVSPRTGLQICLGPRGVIVLPSFPDLSHSLNSLKGDFIGEYYRGY